MPTTRSMKKALSTAINTVVHPNAVRAMTSKSTNGKRRKVPVGAEDDSESQPVAEIPEDAVSSTSPVKKPRIDIPESTAVNSVTFLQSDSDAQDVLVLPAALCFSFEAAREHLINADSRFRDIFDKLPCRPFQHLEKVDPFRTLTTSILGQQISWLAARSITHRFIRLYYPHLPEKLPPAGSSEGVKVPQELFPTAQQVAESEIDVLKSAGLSTRKAEYVKDLASRFADGRLTTKRLLEADDEELARLLIEVRGIGRWTVDMFAIFSLRRPDILPVGDLGVQRGMLRWFLALHSPADPVQISPKKLPKNPGNMKDDEAAAGEVEKTVQQSLTDVNSAEPKLPGPPPPTTLASQENDISSLPPAPPATPVKRKNVSTGILGTSLAPASASATEESERAADTAGLPAFPEPFTPSVNKILKRGLEGEETTMVSSSLPEGLSVAVLKSRLSGKKVKGAFLTPQEMEVLAEPWRPYRSLGVYYMWALAEEPAAKK